MTDAKTAGAAGGAAGPARAFVARVERTVDLIGRAASWLTLAIVVLMAIGVLLRYAFSIGSVWAQELEWHLLAPLVLFGMTYALLKGEHVRVDVLYARYSPRTQAAVDLLSALLALAMAVLVIRYSIQFVSQSYVINEISSDPGGLTHRWVLKALIPVGFAVFGLMASAQGVSAALRLLGPQPPATPEARP
jgi:TRAP-type mannitol/chloroaromatic compound transport system permease small subunit